MRATIDVEAPDGWICEVTDGGEGTYVPVAWKRSAKAAPGAKIQAPSFAIRRYIFTSPEEAMLAAFRERLQRANGGALYLAGGNARSAIRRP